MTICVLIMMITREKTSKVNAIMLMMIVVISSYLVTLVPLGFAWSHRVLLGHTKSQRMSLD